MIAEDSVLLLAGLTKLLDGAGFEVCATAGDADELLAAVERERPDVVIADVRMPPAHTDEGIRAALVIRRQWPDVAILVLSQYVEERYAADLLSANTRGVGYLLKDRVADVAEFLDALRRVAAGGTALDPEVVAQLLVRTGGNPLDDLTQRERDVLALMAEGRSNAEIGAALVITESAVSKHINSIFAKLGLYPGDVGHRRVLAVLRYLGVDPGTRRRIAGACPGLARASRAVPAYDPTDANGDVGWAGETTLDVEWAHSMAPGASILLVETPVAETEGTAGMPQIVKAENYVINHHLGQVISQSFGATEQTFPSAASIQGLRSAYFNAARNHVTVLAATGDAGATDYANAAGTLLYTHRAIDWPSLTRWSPRVGGTQLALLSTGQRTQADRVWNDSTNYALNDAFFGTPGPSATATGGGLSTVFARPSYQDSVAGWSATPAACRTSP